MPKPEIDPALLDTWEKQLNEAESQLEHVLANPVLHAKLHEVGLAAKWLRHVLVSDNVPKEKADQFFALFSQKAFAVPDVWELAKKTIEVNRQFQNAKKNLPYPTAEVESDTRDELFNKFTRVHSE